MNKNIKKLYFLPKDIKLVIYLIYISLVFFLFFYGFCNTEDYESIISAMVSQEYFHISKDMGFWEINLIVIPFFAWINSFFPGVQIYGYYIFFITAFVGFLGLNLILNFETIKRQKKLLVSLCFMIFYSINLINLQSTRVAVTLIFIFLIHYTYNSLSKNKLALIFVCCIILRIDAVVLLSLSYVVICSIFKKYKELKIWFPFALSFTLLLLLNFAVTKFGNNGVNKFYYYEIEISDKQNIDFNNISESDKTIMDYWYSHLIFDENFYKTSFIKEVIAEDSGHFFNNLISPQLYINTLKKSLPAIFETAPFIGFSLLLLILNLYALNKIKYKLLLFYLFVFPLFICLYISIPTRFLYPYYSSLILFSIILLPYNKDILFILLLPIILIIVDYGSRINNDYLNLRYQFNTTMNKVNTLSKSGGKDLFFENFYLRSWNFVSPDIRHVYQNNQIHFLSFPFFQYFDLYKNDWSKVDKTVNYQSILKKIQYLEKNNLPLIIQDDSYVKVYNNYLMKRYGYKTTVQYIEWSKIN